MDNSSKALAERTDCECDVMWIWNQILYRFELVPSSRSNKSGKESGRQTCFCCLEWPILKVSTPCSVNISHSSGFPTGIYHMMHKIWHYILLCLCPVNAAPVRLPLLSLCIGKIPKYSTYSTVNISKKEVFSIHTVYKQICIFHEWMVVKSTVLDMFPDYAVLNIFSPIVI